MSKHIAIQNILNSFIDLGEYIRSAHDEKLISLIESSHQKNGWFTPANISFALNSWGDGLQKNNVQKWFEGWQEFIQNKDLIQKNVGIIMAGNIPMVGFHDLLCTLSSNHRCIIKSSSKDPDLIPFLSKKLIEFEPALQDKVFFADKLNDIEAVIATGSNNSARYFEYYFGKYPHIIRKNRTSLAILSGDEKESDLINLGKDIFTYFGLGCRNISKLLVPKNYDFKFLLDTLNAYKEVANHNKYMNNVDYHRAILLMNKTPHLDTGFLLLKEDAQLFSPTGIIFYEYYRGKKDIQKAIQDYEGKIQCIVEKSGQTLNSIRFGSAQSPQLWDYADNVNTMEFLLKL